MSRPFPNTFDKESSPMSSLSTGSNTPTSYRANVSRQKTKKWVDAKPADYGGDDWGDDYEDEYDPQPPPPISKPTGMRQPGQAIQSQSKGDSSTGGNGKKSYGELPTLSGTGALTVARDRSNSFDAGDEKCAFSSSTSHQPSSSTAPATRFSQLAGGPTQREGSSPPALSIETPQPPIRGLRKASEVVSFTESSIHREPTRGQVDNGEPSSAVSPQSADTRTPSSDYQARRDFSPSAVPPPLQTRGSSAPPSTSDSASTRFPPRKSSMTQQAQPDLSAITRPTQESFAPKSRAQDRSSSPDTAPHSSTNPSGKSLPFIRPADIYRRMEEERDKERQSIDSSRPSMDSVLGTRSSDRSASPVKPLLREQSSSDSLGRSGRRRTSFEGDDASDSNHRLMPILEPVRERKSEYGFEGFDVNNPPASEPKLISTPARSGSQLDVQKDRRQSISPKLPDLNRISGFSLDMFSQSKPEGPEEPLSQDQNPTATSSGAHLDSPANNDPILRNQPSLGFRSVVNQAFDRSSDSSVPATPASRSGSGVRRTNSESTGTTGISPIMSRVPSTAIPETRNQAIDTRDVSTPAIPEDVNEPNSPLTHSRGNTQLDQIQDDRTGPVVPSFKPGHRRDISTPSPGNSPARTPDVAMNAAFSHSQEALLLETPASAVTEADDSDEYLPHPSRPFAEREQSFRPTLPGEWASYATTTTSNTANAGESSSGTAAHPERTQTPVGEVSPISEHRDEDDYDLTPTTTRNSLPQSALSAAAGATFGDMALGRHDKGSPMGNPVSESPRAFPGSGSLPIPDPAIVLGSDLHSSDTLDPRLLPKLEQTPLIAQSRPGTVNRVISASSSAPPTPPPKDTPVLQSSDTMESTDTASGYFPAPPVPLKQKTMEEVASNKKLEPRVMLPTLCTDTRLHDEESDELRNEIVKSFSLRGAEAHSGNEEGLLSDRLDKPTSGQARESTYLPSEYDNYWATTAEEDKSALSAPHTSHIGAIEQPVHLQISAPIGMEPLNHEEPKTSPILPLNASKAERTVPETWPGLLPNRFSWEASSEHVSIEPSQDDSTPADQPQSGIPGRSASQAVDPLTNIEGNREPFSEHGPATSAAEGAQTRSPVSVTTIGGFENLSSMPDTSEDHTDRKDAALVAGSDMTGSAAAAAAYTHHPQTQNLPEHRLSLAEEKDSAQTSSYPVSPTLPEGHPARFSQPYTLPTKDESSNLKLHCPASPKEKFLANAKIFTFKDIAAMKTPDQRIRTYDETRHQFAAMNSGLAEWLTNLKAQHAEHSNATGSWGESVMSSPNGLARTKFSKAIGGGAPPLQQPYYQQYLNASSPTSPATPTSRPGPNMPTGSQQGISSTGGKITSQQVQAKGKELLYTAGIFGGKAGKAGKGLLAKGKSRLRGSGGGDKVD